MVLNKVSGILGVVELTLEENKSEKVARNLEKAAESIHELVNWVKFLQIAHDLRMISLQSEKTVAHENRKDTRYPLPEIYRKYLAMKINIAGSFEEVIIKNISRQGVQFSSPGQLDINSVIDCVLYSTLIIERKVCFRVKIKYCARKDGELITGAKIEEMPDNIDFDFFNNVFEFIKESLPGR